MILFEHGPVETFEYVTLQLDPENGDLLIRPTPEFHEEYDTLQRRAGRRGTDHVMVFHVLQDLAEGDYARCMDPDELGALTGCGLILGEDPDWPDELDALAGQPPTVKRVWWQSDYCIKNPLEELHDGELRMTYAGAAEDDEEVEIP